MSERQFNTLLQLIAHQGERIEYIVQEMKQHREASAKEHEQIYKVLRKEIQGGDKSIRKDMEKKFMAVRKEMKQGFDNQSAIILDILAHVDERFNEHERKCQLLIVTPSS